MTAPPSHLLWLPSRPREGSRVVGPGTSELLMLSVRCTSHGRCSSLEDEAPRGPDPLLHLPRWDSCPKPRGGPPFQAESVLDGPFCKSCTLAGEGCEWGGGCCREKPNGEWSSRLSLRVMGAGACPNPRRVFDHGSSLLDRSLNKTRELGDVLSWGDCVEPNGDPSVGE